MLKPWWYVRVVYARDNELLEAAPNCRWLQVGSAGVETVDMSLLIERDIELTNAAVIYGPQLADHNMALVRENERNFR